MKYTATIYWQKQPTEIFTDNRYSRVHQWKFDGIEVKASASPHVVPLPLSQESAIDPEEVFVAAISSCHMLFFLSLAQQKVLQWRSMRTGQKVF
jgi:organic hydroperoxide reductase OsmC/OhrA